MATPCAVHARGAGDRADRVAIAGATGDEFSYGDVYNYGIPLPGSPLGLPLPAAINTVGAH
jgi:hypothetical protein